MKKKRAIIVHRWEESPKGDWYPWLAKELRKQGWGVMVPFMPNPDAPAIGPWVEKLNQVAKKADQSTFLIGHSIGCQTILRFLERQNKKIGGAVFVTPWVSLKKMDKESMEIARPWQKTPIRFSRVRRLIPHSLAVFSDNDPWVPLTPNKKVFENNVGSTSITLHQAGHVTKKDGYRELPIVLGWLLAASSGKNL